MSPDHDEYRAAFDRESAWGAFVAGVVAGYERRLGPGTPTPPADERPPTARRLAHDLGWLAYKADPTLGIGRRDLEDREGRHTPQRAAFCLALAFRDRPDWFRGAAACWVAQRLREHQAAAAPTTPPSAPAD